MLNARQTREVARIALKGKWGLSVITALIAGLLGAAGTTLPQININMDTADFQQHLRELDYGEDVSVLLRQTWDFFRNDTLGKLSLYLLFAIAIAAIVYSIAVLILGGAVSIGFGTFTLSLVDGRPASLKQLFSAFDRFGTAFLAYLLRGLFVFLWTLPGFAAIVCGSAGLFFYDTVQAWRLLFLCPILFLGGIIYSVVIGTIKTLSYSQIFFLLTDHKEMTAIQAISHSRKLMQGNKARLFILELSFIGWAILCAFTFGIGALFLSPYTAVSAAVFYRDMTVAKANENPVSGQPNIMIQ